LSNSPTRCGEAPGSFSSFPPFQSHSLISVFSFSHVFLAFPFLFTLALLPSLFSHFSFFFLILVPLSFLPLPHRHLMLTFLDRLRCCCAPFPFLSSLVAYYFLFGALALLHHRCLMQLSTSRMPWMRTICASLEGRVASPPTPTSTCSIMPSPLSAISHK
jgi:hypothetical protein